MSKKIISIQTSDVLSFVALIVSVISIYFSVFYKDHDLTVSLIDTKVEYDGNKISANLLYHNRGNTYSTIIQDYLIFYQQEDWANKGIMFNNGEQVFEFDYNSIVMSPGEQVLRGLDILTDFSKIDTIHRTLNLKNTIKVGLVVTYINDVGLKTSDMFPIGYVRLNDKRRIFKYKLEYDVFHLDGEHYFSSSAIE